MTTIQRVPITHPPFEHSPGDESWQDRGYWPAHWVRCRGADQPPFVTAYRLCFTLDEPANIRLHVSADERYELYLDGQLAGRGPERSDTAHWCFESYQCHFETGEHVMVARVWALGKFAPHAQQSAAPGFLLAAEQPFTTALSTGQAPWQATVLPGITFSESEWRYDSCVGFRGVTDLASYPADIESGGGDGWGDAVIGRKAHGLPSFTFLDVPPFLHPAALPPMLNAPRRIGRVKLVNDIAGPDKMPLKAELSRNQPGFANGFQALLDHDRPMTIPPHTRQWVLVDLEDYYCVYPRVTLAGAPGSRVSIEFSESLVTEPEKKHKTPKGNRGEFNGKYWMEFQRDVYLPGGDRPRNVMPLWFLAGRWMVIRVETGDAPLRLEKLELFETRYPLEQTSRFATNDPLFERISTIMMRTLQMCSHETFFDCPYYEQLMYVGGTPLQGLITYAVNGDHRLSHKAVRLFDWSRSDQGLTASCYPNRGRQTIPTFSLIWIAMVHDNVMWSDAPDLAVESMPTVRSIINHWETCRRSEDHLVVSPRGWNFVDWVRPEGVADDDSTHWGQVNGGVKWDIGVPPKGYHGGVSGLINLFYAYFLWFAADLEERFGEPELAKRCRRLQRETFKATHGAFYSREYGMYADDLGHTMFSEHSQCLALLSELLDAQTTAKITKALFAPPVPMAETTYYFSHYYFEACRLTGRIDKLLEYQSRWQMFLDRGLKTTLEAPEPSRSDCHAWAAHPLFHWYATLLGIRPSEAGFKRVTIQPQLGPLKFAHGEMPHPCGMIGMEVQQEKDGQLAGWVELPEGLDGELRVNGTVHPLRVGRTVFQPSPGQTSSDP